MEYISKYKDLFGLGDISSFAIFSVLLIILILVVFKRINNVYLISLLTLPGTFMHELMHLIASFLTFGKPKSFSIIPKKTNTGVTLGSVSSANITWYNAIIISLAPLLLYFIAYYIMKELPSNLNPLYYYAIIYFVANLLFAGTPSPTDWKLAFKKSWFLLLLLVFGYVEYKYNILHVESFVRGIEF